MTSMLRRNEMDVSLRVCVNRRNEVEEAVASLYQELYQCGDTGVLGSAFETVRRIYGGEDARYHACDTWYHDLQHSLDVTLAMARLMDGYERMRQGGESLDRESFELGVVAALFHDVGYVRRRKDTRHRHGAEYTLTHVGRSADFVREFLGGTALAGKARIGSALVRFTNHRMATEQIRLSTGIHRLVGQMVGAADFMAQMADRCYLEKCYWRLFPEFVLAGLAGDREDALFSSAEEMVYKTPGFFHFVTRRMHHDLGGAHHFARAHFGGDNLYLDAIQRNMSFAQQVAEAGEIGLLRRRLPDNAIPLPLLN